MRRLDLTGQRFGRLVAVKNTGIDGHGRSVWACKCDCGADAFVAASVLRRTQKSCGCLVREKATKHGGSSHPLYKTWAAMIERCESPNNKSYHSYGGRGIKVCKRWRDNFGDWLLDMGERPSPKHSIDRIDPNGDYEPSNCRRSTSLGQQRNRRNNILVTVDGKTDVLSAWVERYGTDYFRTHDRIVNHGWDAIRALTEPAMKRGRAAVPVQRDDGK